MAINFEAANMAGYNTPQVQVFPVTVEVAGSQGIITVVGAPSYSTFTNIIKSGYMPTLFATLPTGDKAVLPLTAINNEGIYIFSAAIKTSAAANTEMLISILYGESFDAPIFYSIDI